MFNWLQQRLETRRDAQRTQQQARKIYEAIVAQARQPEFYRSMGISDTVPGRFEMVTLHMYLILERLRQLEPDGELLAQSLVDVMFDDMDDVAREIGVGDMAVAPKIKKLARSFRSRLEAYERAMGRSDDTPEVRDEPDPTFSSNPSSSRWPCWSCPAACR